MDSTRNLSLYYFKYIAKIKINVLFTFLNVNSTDVLRFFLTACQSGFRAKSNGKYLLVHTKQLYNQNSTRSKYIFNLYNDRSIEYILFQRDYK